MSQSRYRGFKIVARPYQLFGSRRWISDLEIRRDGRSQDFGMNAQYGNELDADAGGVRAGREIIDSRLAEISVEYVRGYARSGGSSVSAPQASVFGPLVLAGLVLLNVGAFVLFGGHWFTAQPEVFQVGEVQFTAVRRPTIAPGMGVVVLLVGAGLVVTGLRKRPG